MKKGLDYSDTPTSYDCILEAKRVIQERKA